MGALPPLFGWKHVSGSSGLWQRGRQLVQHTTWGRWVFLDPARNAEVLSFYLAPPRKEAFVHSGCLVYRGRLVPRPYRLLLADGKITVNGLFIKDVKSRHREGQLSDFDHEVQMFKDHTIDILASTMTSSGKNRSEDVVQDFIQRINTAVAGGGTTDEVIKRLQRIDRLHTIGSAAIREIAENWKKGPATQPARVPARPPSPNQVPPSPNQVPDKE